MCCVLRSVCRISNSTIKRRNLEFKLERSFAVFCGVYHISLRSAGGLQSQSLAKPSSFLNFSLPGEDERMVPVEKAMTVFNRPSSFATKPIEGKREEKPAEKSRPASQSAALSVPAVPAFDSKDDVNCAMALSRLLVNQMARLKEMEVGFIIPLVLCLMELCACVQLRAEESNVNVRQLTSLSRQGSKPRHRMNVCS